MKQITNTFAAISAVVGVLGCGASDGPSGSNVGTPATVFEDAEPALALSIRALPDEIEGRQLGACLVFEDLDGDERPDIFVASTPVGRKPVDEAFVLQNTPSGFQFHRVALARPIALASSCAAADVDGDGDHDIFVGGPNDALLLINNATAGSFLFEEVGVQSGLSPLQFPDVDVGASAFIQANSDGWPDLWIGHRPYGGDSNSLIDTCAMGPDDFYCTVDSVEGVSQHPSILYLNQGDGTFVVDASSLELSRSFYVNAVGAGDWNKDGHIDLVISNDFSENQLLEGDGQGGFIDATDTWGVRQYNHGMGSALADFDADGEDELYIADLGADQLWFGSSNKNVDWSIVEATAFHSSWAPLAADFNHDGWMDLFVVSSGVVQDPASLNVLGRGLPLQNYPQQHDLLLTHRGPSGGFDAAPVPHDFDHVPSPFAGLSASADMDGDGDLELAVLSGGFPVITLRLLDGEATPRAGTMVYLKGRWPNTMALGARVEASIGQRVVSRLRVSQSGSLGVSSGGLHFGFRPERIRVVWFGGQTSVVEGPFQSPVLTITQP